MSAEWSNRWSLPSNFSSFRASVSPALFILLLYMRMSVYVCVCVCIACVVLVMLILVFISSADKLR